MTKEFRIKLKQRWEYRSGGNACIAEVVTHPFPSAPYADLKVKQVLAGIGFAKNQIIWSTYLLSDNSWTYLKGQDRP
jgi:hypothetical protein